MKTKVKCSISGLFVTLVTISLLFLSSGCGDQSTPHQNARPVAVRVIKPIETSLEESLSYLGTVHARREIKVIAQVQGTLTNLPFREGQKISRGDFLAEIEAPDLQAVVDRLRAERDYWLQRYQTDQRLVEKEAIAPEQLEVSKRTFKSANAALVEGESRLSKTRESSPFSGQVLSWLVEPGQNVMPGQPILLIADNELEIHTDVVEEDLYQGITVGKKVKIFSEGTTVIPSQVTDISPISAAYSRTFTVKIPLPAGSNHSLRIGSSARVEFILKDKQASLAVPTLSIVDDKISPYIFLIHENRAYRTPVSPGIVQDGWVEVNFSWNRKDLVAVSNLGSLRDSSLVYAVQVEEVK